MVDLSIAMFVYQRVSLTRSVSKPIFRGGFTEGAGFVPRPPEPEKDPKPGFRGRGEPLRPYGGCDLGKWTGNHRKASYLMVKTMVKTMISWRYSLKPIQWYMALTCTNHHQLIAIKGHFFSQFPIPWSFPTPKRKAILGAIQAIKQ